MPRKRKTTQMGDNPSRWKNKPEFSSEWVSYSKKDLEELRKLKERKLKYNKRGQRNISRKYRFKK